MFKIIPLHQRVLNLINKTFVFQINLNVAKYCMYQLLKLSPAFHHNQRQLNHDQSTYDEKSERDEAVDSYGNTWAIKKVLVIVGSIEQICTWSWIIQYESYSTDRSTAEIGRINIWNNI